MVNRTLFRDSTNPHYLLLEQWGIANHKQNYPWLQS